jgi:hypothetical protein
MRRVVLGGQHPRHLYSHLHSFLWSEGIAHRDDLELEQEGHLR